MPVLDDDLESNIDHLHPVPQEWPTHLRAEFVALADRLTGLGVDKAEVIVVLRSLFYEIRKLNHTQLSAMRRIPYAAPEVPAPERKLKTAKRGCSPT